MDRLGRRPHLNGWLMDRFLDTRRLGVPDSAHRRISMLASVSPAHGFGRYSRGARRRRGSRHHRLPREPLLRLEALRTIYATYFAVYALGSGVGPAGTAWAVERAGGYGPVLWCSRGCSVLRPYCSCDSDPSPRTFGVHPPRVPDQVTA